MSSDALPDTLVRAVDDLVEQVKTHRHMFGWLSDSRYEVPWRNCSECIGVARIVVDWARDEVHKEVQGEQ